MILNCMISSVLSYLFIRSLEIIGAENIGWNDVWGYTIYFAKKIEKFSGHCIFDNYIPYFVWDQNFWDKKIAKDCRNRGTIQICCNVVKNLRFIFPQ